MAPEQSQFFAISEFLESVVRFCLMTVIKLISFFNFEAPWIYTSWKLFTLGMSRPF